MSLDTFVREMPKVELHVHLEGSIRPATLLKLASRHGMALPADTVEGLQEWYQFRDFKHFVEVYVAISKTIKTPEDIELIAREFLEGQAEQNILHSDVTFTSMTIERFAGIPWDEQLDALNRARDYGERELNTTMSMILDIVRGCTPEAALRVAEQAVAAHGNGVGALGLAGEEGRCPVETYHEAFALAKAGGLPIIPHAGETQPASSVMESLRATDATRIGHGVRSIEDKEVFQTLIDRGVTLEVCPTSNICLGVYPALSEHVLPRLLDAGIAITINSDDPPMFNTTLTNEYIKSAETFGLSTEDLRALALNAARVTLVDESRRSKLLATIDGYA